MQAQDSQSTFQITLPAVNQPLTFDDFRPISPAALEESAAFVASSCHSGMHQGTFVYNTTEQFGPTSYNNNKNSPLQHNTAFNLGLSSPAQSLISYSIESDFPMDSHGPSTPEEWSTMLTNADKAYQQSWNSGVAPYYDSYAAQDMSCSTIQASQIAHLGSGFENQPPIHPSDDLLSTSTGSAYPTFVSMTPLPYGRDLSHPGSDSNVPRGFNQHTDVFSSLMVPPVDSDARHSSPSSFSTQDDATTNTRASSVSLPRKRRSHDKQRRPSPAAAAASKTLLPYPASISLPSMKTLTINTTTLECTECNVTFRDLATLQKHVKSEHTRPLVCIFHYAGCTSRFASKNEWKRHVSSQHLALRYWICTEGTCGQTRGPSTRSRAASLPAFGSIFNRKDLYTQHIRRMHLAPEDGSPVLGGPKKPSSSSSAAAAAVPSEIEDRMRELQANAARIRCALPRFMLCPAPGCPSEFRGPNAWDDRMEHVACHLERAAAGEEPPVSFGGPGDWTLSEWAASDGVNVTRQTASGTWKLCSPLRGEGGGGGPRGGRCSSAASRANAARKASVPRSSADEEDAEGEECAATWSNRGQ